MDAAADPTRQLVRLRGRSYVAFVFCPVVPIVDWLDEIDATLARSPGFFVGKPVVLDLSARRPQRPAIAHLVASLERAQAFASSVSRAWTPTRLDGEHAAVADRRPRLRDHAQRAGAEAEPEAKPKPTSLLLESPVRSGQSIVFTEGDVTVLGSVGSGAEIVAGGSIHIYGTLRGRAMAGVNGNSGRADLLPEDRGGAARHRRLLPDRRRNRRHRCATGRPKPG